MWTYSFHSEFFPLCPVTTCSCKKSLSIFHASSLQGLESCNKIISKSCLFQAEQSQLSQPFLTGEVLHPSDQLGGLHWTCSNGSMSFLCWWPQSWIQYSRCDLVRAEQRSRILSLALLPMLLLMQPRLSFWVVSALYWVRSSLSATTTPKPISDSWKLNTSRGEHRSEQNSWTSLAHRKFSLHLREIKKIIYVLYIYGIIFGNIQIMENIVLFFVRDNILMNTFC